MKHKFFYTENSTQLCGLLDLETVSETHRYITEKMYQKEISLGNFITACKGVAKYLKTTHLENHNQKNLFNSNIKEECSIFRMNSSLIVADREDNVITKEVTKSFGIGMVPTKRHFYESGHSITYKVE